MSSALFDAAIPSVEEIADLLPGPRSMVRRRLSDPRALLGAGGYALALQITHPTVAAGVRDHSDFQADPWGRAFRTADYLFELAYGSPDEVATLATNLRTAHRPIRGIDGHGVRYAALEPAAYAWVHATIGHAIVVGHDHLGTTFSAAEREQFWQEWLRLGTVIGVRAGDLPGAWPALQQYVADMMNEVLERTEMSDLVLGASHNAIGGSPFSWLPPSVFGAVGRPAGNLLRLLAGGMLRPDLRRRFGMRWGARQQLTFDAWCRASKAAGPLLPRPVRQLGPLALRARRLEPGAFSELLA